MEFSEYLFSEAGKLFTKDEKWTFNFDEKGVVRFYHFKEHCKYLENQMLPLEWIPELKKHNEKIHDLVMCTLGLVAKKWDLDVIRHSYNDFILDDIESYYSGEPDDDQMLEANAAVYTEGAANNFQMDLRRAASKYDVNELKIKIRATRFNGTLQKQVKRWLLLGIDAINNSAKIHDYFFRDDEIHNDGDPIKPQDYMSMVWTFHDEIHQMSEDYINNNENEMGAIGPVIRTEYFHNRKPKSDAGEEIKYLYEFLDFGRDIYFDSFNTHFQTLHSDSTYRESLNQKFLPKPYKKKRARLIDILK